MKKFSILTLFPNSFQDFMNTSIIKKAIERKKISVELYDIRQFSNNKHNQVDDYPYGGGAGMVLQALPVIKAIEKAKENNTESLVVLFSPQGKVWNQTQAYQFAKSNNNYIFVCGHYEGIDERIMNFIDLEISIGDYVLTGGELPAMILVDSISRLIDDVINNDSHVNDSLNNNLLDYPTYTRPEEILGMKVPEVLLSGHHKNIEYYRKEQSLINTYEKRPDIFVKHELTKEEKKIIDKYLLNKK